MRSIVSRVALAFALLVVTGGARAHAAPDEASGAPSSEEAILEARLMAPCCYVQTLDIHESELATALRHEIRTRLAAGESAADVEQDFVARYGERVRALPAGQDPRKGLGSFAAVVAAAAAVGLGVAIRRWRRAADAAPDRRSESAAHDEYDERVDEELRRLDA